MTKRASEEEQRNIQQAKSDRIAWIWRTLPIGGHLADMGSGVWKLWDDETEWCFAADVDDANDAGFMVDTHVPGLSGVEGSIQARTAIRESIESEGL